MNGSSPAAPQMTASTGIFCCKAVIDACAGQLPSSPRSTDKISNQGRAQPTGRDRLAGWGSGGRETEKRGASNGRGGAGSRAQAAASESGHLNPRISYSDRLFKLRNGPHEL